MASSTRWTWVDSGNWWWTGRPGVLWSMGSQRAGHDWVTELNWTLFKENNHKDKSQDSENILPFLWNWVKTPSASFCEPKGLKWLPQTLGLAEQHWVLQGMTDGGERMRALSSPPPGADTEVPATSIRVRCDRLPQHCSLHRSPRSHSMSVSGCVKRTRFVLSFLKKMYLTGG